MYTVQFDAPFEIQKMEIRELPFPLLGASHLILRDKRGRWLVDPRLVGIWQVTAFKQAHKKGRPVYELGGEMFADLKWLLSGAMTPYRETKGNIENPPYEQVAHILIATANCMPAESVEVKMIRRVPDVFSEH